MDATYKIHPICDLFPMMEGEQWTQFREDIKAHGLIKPIVMYDGEIVDGRNRLRACQETGVKLRFAQWKDVYNGPLPLSEWIWSENFSRRQMTKEQAAAVVAARRAYDEMQAARNRQSESADQLNAKRWGKDEVSLVVPPPQAIPRPEPPARRLTDLVQPAPTRAPAQPAPTRAPAPSSPTPEPARGRVRQILAKEAGVPENMMRRTLDVQDKKPELLKDIAQGKMTLRQAEDKVKEEKIEKENPELLKQVEQGKITLREAVAKVKEEKLEPSQRQVMIENAAKRRMINGLSLIEGSCKGLSGLDVNAIRNQCTPEEVTDWSSIARESAKVLRAFAIQLCEPKEENNKSNA
jgi:ribosomal protein S21